MKREIRFREGYDCIRFNCKFNIKECVPNGGGSHGKHGLEICFYVKGDKGAVQFVLSTGWLPQKVSQDTIGVRRFKASSPMQEFFPMPVDLGYHSYKPHYEGQKPLDKCDLLDGKPCYYDGSGLNCNDAFYALLNGGDKALWEFLEQYYKCVFEDGKYPEPAEYGKGIRKV